MAKTAPLLPVTLADTTPSLPVTPPVKILVVADVAGRHKELFQVVKKAHLGKTGPYAALFCVGRFFSDSDESEDAEILEFIEGREHVPLPTYFICGDEAAHRSSTLVDTFDAEESGGELCANLWYLGKGGSQDVSGLSVAFLGGRYDAGIYAAGATAALARGRYSEETVEEVLIAGGAYRRDKGVDLLLTSEWGQGFDNLIEPQDRPLLKLFGKDTVVPPPEKTNKDKEGGEEDAAEKTGAGAEEASPASEAEEEAAAAGQAAAAAGEKEAEAKPGEAVSAAPPSTSLSTSLSASLSAPEALPPSSVDSSGYGGACALSPAVGRLARELSPKYHFASGQPLLNHFALSPYANALNLPTRFYGLGGAAASGGKIKAKAFAVAAATPLPPPAPTGDGRTAATNEEAAAAAAAAATAAAAAPTVAMTAHPYLSPRVEQTRLKLMTVPSKAPSTHAAKEALASGSRQKRTLLGLSEELVGPKPGQVVDEMHTEFSGTGDWRCGYCQNANRARNGQIVRCNMRYCMAPRWLSPDETGGGLSASAREILQMQLAAQAEAKLAAQKADAEAGLESKDSAASGAENESKDALRSGEGDPSEFKKRSKKESLYANQGGGVHNPNPTRYKKGKRPGDPSGPSHNRPKW